MRQPAARKATELRGITFAQELVAVQQAVTSNASGDGSLLQHPGTQRYSRQGWCWLESQPERQYRPAT